MHDKATMQYVAFLVVLLAAQSSATVYSRCGLARELLSCGMPRPHLENWVCLVEAESQCNTACKSSPFPNRSCNYGLFQINSGTHCGVGYPGGRCNMNCNNFLNNNIYDDSVCARKIYSESGFSAWKGWTTNCYRKPLPNLKVCGL